MSKTTKIILWVAGVGAFVALLVSGTIYDLQLSKALASLTPKTYYSTNKLARVIDTIGETVLYIIVDIALMLILHRFTHHTLNKNWLRVLIMVGCVVLSVAVTSYAIYSIVEYLVVYTELKGFLYSAVGIMMLVILGIALILGIYCLTSLLKPETIEKLYKWAIAVLVVAVASNLIAQGLKHIVGRTRYRAIVNEGLDPDTYFTPWYSLGNTKFASTSPLAGDYFKSFPSGHCCAAASVFLFCLLPCFVESTRDRLFYILAPAVCIVYTLLVMISRVIAGAHYFTDTLMGAGITIACILIYKAIFINARKPKTEKQTQ